MNNRRRLVIALGAGALPAPLACFAQQQRSQVARIGVLEADSTSANQRDALIAALRVLGLVEGKNIIIEYRWAEGTYERLPGLAAELVQMKVDVIVAGGSPAVQAARQATASIPMSYGQNNVEHYYRAATYIDRILKGAKPGELPVEQATKVELVINLKTAKAIGLTIPQQLLLQADKVIE